VGRTAKPVTGFRSRSGRTFRAKLKLEQDEEGKWRVDFDEDWAKEPPKGESEEERAEADTSTREREAAGAGGGAGREPAPSSVRAG
jgi:DNA topoisomerase-3